MKHLLRSLIGGQRRRPPAQITWHRLESLEPRVLLDAVILDPPQTPIVPFTAQPGILATLPPMPTIKVTVARGGKASETLPDTRGFGRFVITRSGSTKEALEVQFAMSGTAAADDDYALAAGSIVIPAKKASVFVDLVPVDDVLTEGPEKAILMLTVNAAAYNINTKKTAATITIADNESYLDLVAVSAKAGPKSVKSGDAARKLKFSATLLNRGNTAAPAGTLVHLSMVDTANPDNAIDLGDVVLAKPLGANKRVTLSETIRLGDLAAAPAVGVYQLKAVAEAGPLCAPEVNALDNTLLDPKSTFTVLNPAPVTLKLHRVGVNDSPTMIGGQAATFLVPDGWKMDGSVRWRLHPTAPASLSVRIYNPAGLESAEVFPPGQFAWADYLPYYGFDVGSLYLGNEVRQPPADVLTCLNDIVLPRLRGNVGAQVVAEEETPNYAVAVRAEYPPDGPTSTTTVTAGRIRIDYQLNGQAVEEDLYCALSLMYMPTVNMTYWGVDHVLAIRAAKGQLDNKAAMLSLLGQSMNLNLAWYNKYSQLLQQIFEAKMQDIANQGVLSQIISQTSNNVSDMMFAAYQDHEAMEDRIGQSFTEYIRDEGEYYDPYSEQTFVLPSGYDRVWVNNASDEYVLSQDLNFKPSGVNWHMLEPQ